MKIRTKLFLLSTTFVVLLVAIASLVFQIFDRTDGQLARNRNVNRIVKDTSELNGLTYEYMVHREKRMREQWWLKYDSLGKLLEDTKREQVDTEHLLALEGMTVDHEALSGLFRQLQDSSARKEELVADNGTPSEIHRVVVLEERLVAQLLIRSQKITTDAFRLSGMMERAIVRTQQKGEWLILFSIIGFAVLASCLSFFVIRGITSSVGVLVKGAGIIGDGNLKHKVDIKTRDEIGELGAAFNLMTEKRAQGEKALQQSLKEKEVLLREIYHRVKNNLQVISSLLNLQSNVVDDAPVQEMFQESRNRVRSMALTHEQLYQSDDLARVDFGRYIRDLAGALFRSYGADPAAVRLTVDVADVSLTLDAAIPCGLMVNELVSNCLKHAFPEGGGGEILIRLVSEDDGRHTLAVRDNGVGFPEDKDHRTSPTLGLQLVSSLADQLGGTMELDRTEGTEFRISFGG